MMHRRVILFLSLWPLALFALADNGAAPLASEKSAPGNPTQEELTPRETPAESAWAEVYKSSEWVLQLHIEGVGQLVNPAMSRNRLMAVQGYRYSASVLQTWKGDHQGTVRFQVELNDCPQILQVDREYIVFGSSDYYGVLESDSCDKIIALDDADDSLLPQLERFRSGS